MTGRDDILLEITPQVLLKAYAVGIFPMAESAEDPGLYWIEPEARGIIPLDRFHLPRRLARTVAAGRLRDPHRQRFRGRHRGLRRRRSAAAPRPGSTPASAASTASSSPSAIATPSKPGGTAAWSAASTAFASAPRSSARACSRASATPPRSPSSIWSRGSSPAASASSTRSSPPQHLKQFGAIDVDRRHYHRLLEEAMRGMRISMRCRGGQRGMRSCGRLRRPSGTRRVRRSARAGLRAEGPADDGLSPPVSLPDGVPYVRAVTSGSSAHSTGQLVQAHRTAWKLACGAAAHRFSRARMTGSFASPAAVSSRSGLMVAGRYATASLGSLPRARPSPPSVSAAPAGCSPNSWSEYAICTEAVGPATLHSKRSGNKLRRAKFLNFAQSFGLRRFNDLRCAKMGAKLARLSPLCAGNSPPIAGGRMVIFDPWRTSNARQ